MTLKLERIGARKPKIGFGVCRADLGYHPTILFLWVGKTQVLVTL